MCGRFNVIDDPFTQDLLEQLEVKARLDTQYNIAPTEDIQVVMQEDGANRLRHMRWWLIPSWVKEPGTKYSMFNARAETLEQSPAFRGPFKHQRCIIPASSFIEWKSENGHKHPYSIRPSDQAFAFAGLWDHWGHGAERIYSCSMITTDAVQAFQTIHNRQPVMLPRDAFDQWLNPDIEGDELIHLLRPTLPCALEVLEIDPAINNSRHKKQIKPTGEPFQIWV
ncbi:SOS response-associated peptidase [Marinobacterium mangrovicola]|uniref:Abasic site processing protein n=1 Tax=Marinobacterium mangrovicola TaxID=1476959 RepID=A0A4R1G901_9GAMM|nr:SOS response-associated peptidase [Marinobacterium mangrovicola]TCK02955.1 putative SOS response-associated peptidase YedK [Marinobacterium mangrovicola]